jgi:hypothetical protein
MKALQPSTSNQAFKFVRPVGKPKGDVTAAYIGERSIYTKTDDLVSCIQDNLKTFCGPDLFNNVRAQQILNYAVRIVSALVDGRTLNVKIYHQNDMLSPYAVIQNINDNLAELAVGPQSAFTIRFKSQFFSMLLPRTPNIEDGGRPTPTRPYRLMFPGLMSKKFGRKILKIKEIFDYTALGLSASGYSDKNNEIQSSADNDLSPTDSDKLNDIFSNESTADSDFDDCSTSESDNDDEAQSSTKKAQFPHRHASGTSASPTQSNQWGRSRFG